jgi:hypothetical protein
MSVNVAQTIALSPNSIPNSSPREEKKADSPSSDLTMAKEIKSPVDSVSLSPELQKATVEAQQKAEEIKRATIVAGSSIQGKTAAKVEVVYDQKGELITKYMDSANRLVYQTPSELMLRMKESAPKPELSVNMKA